MAFKLANRAFVLTATTGTGSISLGSVVAGYQSFSAAGITDGDTVRYTIEDGTNWEIGTGTLSNSVGTMARSVIDSSGGGSALTLSGNAKVFLTAAADDILVEVVEDTSPQLGGNLDVQAREITTSTSNGNVKITPNGSGVVEVKGAGGNDGTLQLNCSANSHGVKIKSPPHSAGATYTLTLPNDDGSSGQSLISDGSGNLSFTTITSNATHTGEVTGSGALTIADNIVDEANLKVSNSPTNGYFLSAQSGNTGGLTWAAAGASLYNANENSPAGQPNATGANAVAIGDSAAASGNDSIAIGENTVASGTQSISLGYNAKSSYQSIAGPNSNASGGSAVAFGIANNSSTKGAKGDWSFATGASAIATGDGSKAMGNEAHAYADHSLALGNESYTAGVDSVALGKSYASGTGSIALGINTGSSSYGAQGNYSLAQGASARAVASNTVALHQGAHASGSGGTAIGSYAHADGSNSTAIGNYADAAGDDSFCFGGNSNADGEYSFVFGHRLKATEKGKYVYGFGQFASQGDAQGGNFVLRSDTTDATAEAMTTNNATAAATNQIVAASDTCITFHGTVVAMQNGAQAHAGWEIKGMLVNDGGTTTLALGNVSDMAAKNASSWAVALSADNTNNALKVQVTGEAAHNIRWVANIQTSEVTYA